MLPKQNGIDVLRALRQAKNTTPVILLTALGEVSDKVRGLDARRRRLSCPNLLHQQSLLARLRLFAALVNF